ncbi:hypothetical protein FZ934_18700 [Rhizobium grahamii]|uniref:Glycine zipper family protein n=1 Tax=Rhizobium grahamii TaxID=1120045 RepID=A0A5Q0CA73_9HYPH|nr:MULTISPECIES: DUF6204 family protein [Rhizobium]QFY62245.1 hypothetical protein FZ934_18700 [Rhizobium grahamii]QRM48567.1 hypothetical protein F3Y33_04195 [Rhizobium sp. BG6]
MLSKMLRAVVLGAALATLAGCVDHANAPIMVPVAAQTDPPLNPPGIAHTICTSDGNFMYNEARKQFELRAQMTHTPIDPNNEEAQARAAARRQYVTCLSSQGYRAIYDQ